MVLEGPDNGGKSTLAKRLQRNCGAVIIHSTYRFKGSMYQYHVAQFRKALKVAQSKPVVMDRWWPSEVAYGNTYRDGCEYEEMLPYLQQLGKDYLVSYTFCMPTRWEEYWSWCNRVWKDEDEMYAKDKAAYNWLWMNYRELALNQYRYYHQNLVQHYNVVLEGNRPDPNGFAKYIISRLMDNLKRMSPEEKETFKRMSHHWKLVGRVPNNLLPEIPTNVTHDSSLAEAPARHHQDGGPSGEYHRATQQELPL